MKTEFLSSVSHELKTPLSKILLFAETLQSGRVKRPDKAGEYLEIISGQTRKLARLISGILEFATIEAGVRRYELAEIDLRRVVEAALKSFDYELAQGQFSVETFLPNEEVPVRGSGDGLQQLVENLISNAIKYSRDERYLRVALVVRDGHATIEVSDRGVGIPPHEQRRIFRKFYRGSYASRAGVTGSGLGLAIADHVVRAHGGRISVNSVVGQGSTFVVQLPLSEEDQTGL